MWHNKSNLMANNLSLDEKATVIHALAEGAAIRAVERMTGIHRDTIMRLGVKVGENCAAIMDSEMRNLQTKLLQFDEIWGFVGMKQKHTKPADRRDGKGDCWTFVAVDAESRMVPAFHVSSTRRKYDAVAFCEDVAARMTDRVQISTDALKSYADAVERGFGADADYGQILKIYGEQDVNEARRYSPARLVEVKRSIVSGQPDEALISTSYVERQNLTMRMHMRRLTRLTNAFSKKLENFRAAVSLHFAYYNFVRLHKSLRCTPAMAGGVTDHVWTVRDLIEA
jgi:IS1 family transposase